MSTISGISGVSKFNAPPATPYVTRNNTPNPSASGNTSATTSTALTTAAPASVSSPAPAFSANASNPQTLALLQEQMILYTPQFSSGTGPAPTAYQALEYAIQTNNVSAAQNAMAELQLDSAVYGSPTAAVANGSTLNLTA